MGIRRFPLLDLPDSPLPFGPDRGGLSHYRCPGIVRHRWGWGDYQEGVRSDGVGCSWIHRVGREASGSIGGKPSLHVVTRHPMPPGLPFPWGPITESGQCTQEADFLAKRWGDLYYSGSEDNGSLRPAGAEGMIGCSRLSLGKRITKSKALLFIDLGSITLSRNVPCGSYALTEDAVCISPAERSIPCSILVPSP